MSTGNAHHNRDSRLFVEINISGLKSNALLDTGSIESYISEQLSQSLTSKGVMVDHIEQSVRLADGSVVYISQALKVNIECGNKNVIETLKVLPGLTVNVLFGLDVLTQLFDSVPLKKPAIATERVIDYTQTTPVRLAAISTLSNQQQCQLDAFLEYELSLFADSPSRTHLVTHEIRLKPNTVPVKQRYYPRSPVMNKVLKDEVDQMLKDGTIEESESPWSSPVVLVKKPSGKYRFAVNLKKVNDCTIKDAYPIPYMSAILDKLRPAKFISTLDLKNGYWQVPLHCKQCKELTAFTVENRGLFHFNVMPFGLHSSGATFQRLLDKVIGVDLERQAFPYLDDVILVSENFEAHLRLLKEVFKRLREAGLVLNLDKCKFCQTELKYLGHVVSSAGLKTDPDKVQAIMSYPAPRTVKQLRRFLGLCSWYRKYCPNFAEVVSPLTDLLKKKTPWTWLQHQEDAFSELKRRLMSAPILVCPDFAQPFTIQTDASDVASGSILTQVIEGEERVIAYQSQRFSDVETRYASVERETLAVLHAVRKFRPYIEGQKFTVITDCSALQWLSKLKNPTGRLSRWSLELQQYDFDVKYRSGKLNVVPDALSRAVCETHPVANIITNNNECKWQTELLSRVKNNANTLYKIENGEVLKRLNHGTDSSAEWRLCVRTPDRERVLQECHSAAQSGHLGREKTYKRVANLYYWPGMYKDVRNFVRKCENCQLHKVDQRKTAGTMGLRPIGGTWESVTTDLMGPWPRTSKGNCYVVLFQDRFTKWVEFGLLRQATAKTVTEAFKNTVLYRHGVPRSVLSDHGSQFENKVFSDLAHIYGFEQEFTPRYTPQANPVERTNRSVKCMVKQFCDENQKKWDVLLPELIFAYNTACHTSTGFSPAFLNYGRELNQPNSLSWEKVGRHRKQSSVTVKQHAEALQSRMKVLRDLVEQNLSKASRTQKKYYDQRRRQVNINVGDTVYYRNYKLSSAAKHYSAALAPRYLGPATVSKVLSPRVYELSEVNGKSLGPWHIKDLKLKVAE